MTILLFDARGHVLGDCGGGDGGDAGGEGDGKQTTHCFPPVGLRHPSAVGLAQHGGDEIAGSGVGRADEHFLGGAKFDEAALVEKGDAAGDFAREGTRA